MTVRSCASARARRFAARVATLLVLAVGLPAACGVVGGPVRTVDAASDIRLQELRQPPSPPDVSANAPDAAARAASRLGGGYLATLRARPGGATIDGPELPFFFESAVGRAYLAAGRVGGDGRAIARGAPEESCPALGVVLDAAEPEGAARIALERCLAHLPAAARDRCDCRLLAAAELVFADRAAFAYARGVSAEVIDPADGRSATLVAEEVHPREAEVDLSDAAALDALTRGARRYWLLGPLGPAARLEIAADGAAELVFVEGPRTALVETRRLAGRFEPEGFRRGRMAGVARFLEADGRGGLTLLLGYEPAETTVRRAELLARAARL